MKYPEDIIEKITKGIDWYYENHSQTSLPMLMNAQDKLATLSFNLAEIAGKAYSDYTTKYFLRKKKIIVKLEDFTEAGFNGTISKNKAENEALSAREEETKANGFQRETKLLLDQTNKILEAMKQRISQIKKEWDRANTDPVLNQHLIVKK